MAHLVPPTVTLQASFVEALDEYRRDDAYDVLDPGAARDPAAFARYVEGLRDAVRPSEEQVMAPVPTTTLWWVDGSTYLGTLTIRHRLGTDFLATYGGHLGYRVRPAARGQGHATRMLAAALPVMASLGIDPALVTCDTVNGASRRVIERNGGRFESALDGKLRFWVDTR
ncbi:MAG: GNAT family N-acetyltransferase [Actinomycetes bacterium]